MTLGSHMAASAYNEQGEFNASAAIIAARH
jgi:hypothetical protein